MTGSDIPITIIYASASGNVQFVVEKVAEVLSGHHFAPHVVRAEQADASTVLPQQLFILATSTWEHGELSPYFHKLYEEMSHLDLGTKHAGFIGLGDTRYEPVLFCGGMYKLRDRFLERGGQEIYEPLTINGEPYHQIEDKVSPWVHTFVSEVIHLPQFRVTA